MTEFEVPADVGVSVVATGSITLDPLVGWTKQPQARIGKNAEPGQGEVGVHRTTPHLSKLTDYVHRLVFTYDGDVAWVSRWIEGVADTYAGAGDKGAQTVEASARGLIAELEECIVEPEYGAGVLPFHPVRFFDYRSRHLPRGPGTGWNDASVFPPFGGGDTGVVGIYGRHWPPNGWPAPFAGWVWPVGESSSQMPIGDVYMYKAFGDISSGLDAKGRAILNTWMAADDYLEANMDNAPILRGDEPPGVSWELPYRTLRYVKGATPGSIGHNLTAKFSNFDWGWPSNTYNIAAACWAVFQMTDLGLGIINYDNLLFESGPNPNPTPPFTPFTDGALWCSYPSSEPGFEPGRYLGLLFDEWQATGHLPDWSRTFTLTHDTNGVPWPADTIVPREVNVGTDGLQVLASLVEDDCDVTVTLGAGGPELNLYVKGTLAGASGITAVSRLTAATPADVTVRKLQLRGQG